jgi:uncharacterized membrane protein YuzA (DUF378 family)
MRKAGGDKMAEKNALDWIALVLVVVGGLNWGLVGLFKFDLVEAILGAIPVLQRIVYVLVGLAAAYLIYYMTKK